MRKLDAKGRIKPSWKRKVEVKVECAMQNKRIDDLTTYHIHAPFPEQKQMRVLNVKEMESSLEIDLKDVLWWKFIKNNCRLKCR
jgi:hypothetical protein